MGFIGFVGLIGFRVYRVFSVYRIYRVYVVYRVLGFSRGCSNRRGPCDGNSIGASTGLQGLPGQNSQQARRRTCFNCGRRVRAESGM